MTQRRVLVASYGVPLYDRDSGSRRIYDMVHFLLDSGWSTTFVSAGGPGGQRRYTRTLNQLGVPVLDARRDDVEDVIARACFDVAIFGFWPIAEMYLPTIRRLSPSTKVVIDSIDLQLVRDTRRLLHSGNRTSPPLDDQFGEQLLGELNSYASADAVLTVSQAEADMLNALFGKPGFALSVPDNEERAAGYGWSSREGLLFVGGYRHPPNGDAVTYLCRDIVPRLHGHASQSPIWIVGDGLSESLARLIAGAGATPVGWVPDLNPYLARARVFVAPLRYGAGTKRKLIQSLMAGLPTVATSIAAEGFELVDGEHVLIADEAIAFADAVERLYSDQVLWERLATQGREHMLRQRGREAVQSQFHAALDLVLARQTQAVAPPSGGQGLLDDRLTYQQTQKLAQEISQVVQQCVPPGASLAVVSGGRHELLRLDRPASHLIEPGLVEPGSSRAVLAAIDSARKAGISHLVIPTTATSWLESASAVRKAIELAYQCVAEETSCTVYRLGQSEPRAPLVRARPGQPAPTKTGHEAPRLIAFYLPQFHPIPENDTWWGEGFTEWANVANAKPLFPGHVQPQLPADLGFYDLRVPEVREAQAAMAQAHGIDAFCYYHYWFEGKRLLERPFDEVLKSGSPSIPFCLCWANEPWSRRWDGLAEDVLQPQRYSLEDDLAHIRWLLPAVADPRAVRLGDRPLLLIYQARDLPDPARTVELWRAEVDRAGLGELYLMTVETGWDAGWNAEQAGFDAKVLFQPQFSLLEHVPRLPTAPSPLRVFDYSSAWPVISNPEPVPYRRYETVFPSWDNTPRRGVDGWVVHGSTPEAYGEWLSTTIERAMEFPSHERLVFVNAWNEWAEGCHLEPDIIHGRKYLEATRNAVKAASVATQKPTSFRAPAGHSHRT